MRILHAIRGLNPSFGGPPRVAVRLAAGQASLGHEVTIVCYPRTDPPEAYEGMTRRLPGFDRVRLVEAAPAPMLEPFTAAGARRVLGPLLARADVLHLHDVWDSMVRSAGGQARRTGVPYVIQPNDSLNPWSLRQKALKKRIALALGYRRLIEGSCAVLFGHAEERRLVGESGFRFRPALAGLGGVFREEIEPLPEPGRFFERVPGLRGRPFVLFLSRLHPKKGLDHLAEGFAVAARSIPDLQLVVVGHDEGAREDFERRVAAHGLSDRVHLVGAMHGRDKWEAFRDATCFCLPSRDEAFTVAIIEALAAGLPVVISESCHFDEVESYGAGTIVPLEHDRIGEALARICSDPARRAGMRDAARRLFDDHLSFDRVARDVVQIYRDCLDRRGAGRPRA